MSIYTPFRFRIFVAASIHGMEDLIEVIESAAQKISLENPPFSFIVDSYLSLTTSFMPQEKQGYIDSRIKESHLLFVLVGDNIGEFTMHEFWKGYEMSCNRYGYPRCSVFVKRSSRVSPDVEAFQEQLKEKNQYWFWYSDKEEIKRLVIQEMKQQLYTFDERCRVVTEDIVFDNSVRDEMHENRCVFPDGASLQGVFQNIYPKGQCIYTSCEKKQYSGVFHFEAEHIFSDCSFTGYLCNHPPVGRGYLARREYAYLGEVIEEMLPQGYGKSTSNNGEKTVGFWKNGHLEGRGIKSFPPSSKYDGFYHLGVPYGEGIYTFSNGREIHTRSWDSIENMQLAGNCKYTGMVYLEQGLLGFTKTIPCGRGKLEWKSTGETYIGEVWEMKADGYGTLLFPTNSSFEGYFTKGKINSFNYGQFRVANKKNEEYIIDGKFDNATRITIKSDSNEELFFSGVYCIEFKDKEYKGLTGHGVICNKRGETITNGDFINGVCVC